MIERKTEYCQQVSGNDLEGSPILSVVAKRTYVFGNAKLSLADVQLPLNEEPHEDGTNPELLSDDLDLFPFKLATDFVVKGHVYAYGSPRNRVSASVRVGDHVKRIMAIGDRTCGILQDGSIAFSDSKPFEKIPLCYRFAYGGRDEVAESKYSDPFLKAMGPAVTEGDVRGASLFQYPRNPIGCGYLTEADPAAVAQLRLPNLEDPEDLLTPDRLVTGNPLRWHLLPLPASTGWVHYGWFPRFAYMGFPPDTLPLSQPIVEVSRGHAPENILSRRRLTSTDAFRMTNGASLGLQLPYIRENETVELNSLHPKLERFRFELPKLTPRIWTDGRKGKLNETVPVIHTIVVEPDEARLSIVWRGSAAALRTYLPTELEEMPFRVKW